MTRNKLCQSKGRGSGGSFCIDVTHDTNVALPLHREDIVMSQELTGVSYETLLDVYKDQD